MLRQKLASEQQLIKRNWAGVWCGWRACSGAADACADLCMYNSTPCMPPTTCRPRGHTSVPQGATNISPHQLCHMPTRAVPCPSAFSPCPSHRPGPVVGIEDHFFNYMIYNLSFGLMAPVFEDGQAKIQPTWVVDVANAVPAMLKKAETKGQTVYLSGPETLT